MRGLENEREAKISKLKSSFSGSLKRPSKEALRQSYNSSKTKSVRSKPAGFMPTLTDKCTA